MYIMRMREVAVTALIAESALMYTSGMAEPPEVPTDVKIFEARNQLGKIFERARYFDGVTFVTNRGQRAAAVVPAELGELAEEVGGPAALIALVRGMLAERANSGADI
jgi:prevent-host-death family protein